MLSERRAAAVAKALGAALASDDYRVEASGRGESEPRFPNDSAANRTKNRRVMLTLESTVTTEREIATGELPPLEDGQTATGADGVTFDTSRQFRLRAPRARLVDGNIVVDLELTATDDEVDSSFMFGGIGPSLNPRGGDSTLAHRTAGAVHLLVGTERVHPTDYRVDDGAARPEVWLPLAELSIQNRLDGGQSRTVSVVYPDLGEGLHLTEVTVQADALGLEAFRLTHIPVARGSRRVFARSSRRPSARPRAGGAASVRREEVLDGREERLGAVPAHTVSRPVDDDASHVRVAVVGRRHGRPRGDQQERRHLDGAPQRRPVPSGTDARSDGCSVDASFRVGPRVDLRVAPRRLPPHAGDLPVTVRERVKECERPGDERVDVVVGPERGCRVLEHEGTNPLRHRAGGLQREVATERVAEQHERLVLLREELEDVVEHDVRRARDVLGRESR